MLKQLDMQCFLLLVFRCVIACSVAATDSNFCEEQVASTTAGACVNSMRRPAVALIQRGFGSGVGASEHAGEDSDLEADAKKAMSGISVSSGQHGGSGSDPFQAPIVPANAGGSGATGPPVDVAQAECGSVAMVAPFSGASREKGWYGGIMADNGMIYGIPYHADSVLEIDPQAGVVNIFGQLPPGMSKFKGGVKAQNGLIYGIPYHATNVLEIDPQAKTVNLLGNLPPAPFKFAGGVLAKNGRIYGIPYNSASVLEINPDTREVTSFGDISGMGTSMNDQSLYEKFESGVLADNGKIYCIPGNYGAVLEIDPDSRSVRTFGELEVSIAKFYGGVLASNGHIYGIPFRSRSVLDIDPEAGTATLFGELPEMCSKYFGGIVGKDGHIYGIPYNSDTVLEIDPTTNEISTFGQLGSDRFKFAGAVMGHDGRIYGIPYNSNSVLEIDPRSKTATIFGSVGMGQYKYMGGVVGKDGRIYAVPHSVDGVLQIQPCA